MMKTQNATNRAGTNRIASLLGVGLLALTLTACGGSRAAREQAPANPILEAHLNRTVLDAHVPSAVAVEARLMLAAAQGAQGLTAQEYAQLTSFANDFVKLGQGSLVISVPANAGNSASAAAIAQDAQRALYAGGVDYAKIAGGTYQASGQPNAPVLLSFSRYEATKMDCKPWSAFDLRKTALNLSPDRFGCSQNANLAAMVADPGDLLGARTDTSRDAERIQAGIDKHRKGAIPNVSASVSGGGQ
jgi:pilus assembly protein CpaD